jgi:myotubularin-related protein 6/7/8
MSKKEPREPMDQIRTAKVEGVKLLDRLNPRVSPVGKLYLTTSHLIFIEDGANKEVWILHMLMSSIDKPLLTTSGSQLRIMCSQFQTVTFVIQRDKDAHDVYQSLLDLSTPKELIDLYCFTHNPKGELRQSTGWHFHDLRAEFQRQGVPNENWAVCMLNKDYKLCLTYPQYLFVPAKASQEVVEGSAKFRSKGRLPVLTYLHKNGAALIRCAQPLVGIGGRRSTADEQYMECLRRATPGASIIQVVDTRPMVNAKVNMASGKGHENDKFYENMRFSFKGIENIHKMRKSLEHMMATTLGGGSANLSMDGFMTELANSGWLKHIRAVLDTSLFIVNFMLEGYPVVVHCSDGWDRTSQTCALACLMLDGSYRTIQGFQALIEKDWLAFGHKFQDRCGQIESDPNEVSPIFLQFLDAVWQMTHMFPQAFQFNERYLITIHEHVYTCQYGTLIGNYEAQRAELRLREKTYSLWGYLVAHNDEFVNPLYERSSQQDILKPDLSPQNIRFWRGLYCRFETGAHPREPIIDLLTITQVILDLALGCMFIPSQCSLHCRTTPPPWKITGDSCRRRFRMWPRRSAVLKHPACSVA